MKNALRQKFYFKYGSILLLICTAALFTHCKMISNDKDAAVRDIENISSVSSENNIPKVEPNFEDPEKYFQKRCNEVRILTIWLDLDSNGVGDVKLGNIEAYSGDISAAENYNYYSWSAHPINGPTPNDRESHVFLYDGPEGLSFNFYHNKDDGGSNSYVNIVEWDITTIGNNQVDSFLLMDDPNELSDGVLSNRSDEIYYQAYFQYRYNTDGAVIGPFVGEKFEIIVKTKSIGDNINAAFYSGNGDVLSLVDSSTDVNEISSFIIRNAEECVFSNI